VSSEVAKVTTTEPRSDATYDLFHPHIADSGATGTGVVLLSGSLHWPLGRLAALLGHTEEALGHYRAAVTAKLQLTNRTELAAWALRGPGP
jgi:hypothetical protein